MSLQSVDLNSILSAVIGGLIAIVPAYFIEKHKRKKEKNIKGSYEVLIPLGKDLELIKENFFENNSIGCNDKINNCIETLEKYLVFDKKIFLEKIIFQKILKIIEFVKKIDKELEKEYENFMKEYREFLIEYLEEFDTGEYISLNFSSIINTDVKKMIFQKKSKTLRELINIVEFVYIDELEKRKSRLIKCGPLEMLEYSGIEYVGRCEETLSDDSIELIEFFIEHITPNEKNKVEELIGKTKTSEMVRTFLIFLHDLKDSVTEKVELD